MNHYETQTRPRLLVLTDIGGDPDDEQSLVRLLVHADAFDIEGIIPELWVGHKGRHGSLTPEKQMDVVREALACYGQVEANLRRHADGFPSCERLLDVLKRGHAGVVFTLDQKEPQQDCAELVGPGKDTEGSDWIIHVVDQDDPRPVNITVWGGTADLAQALWRVRKERNAQDLVRFVSKIRVYAVDDQDDTGPWIRTNFPELFYILNYSRDGNKWHSCYRGMFLGGDESLTSREWVDKHVRTGHGPLGAFYSERTYTGPNPHKTLKEGDTPSWFYFYDNGLHVPIEPRFGGWGGRFAPNNSFWQDAEDTVDGETSHMACIWRWRPEYQNEFQARMDWCVATPGEANHRPLAVVNGDATRRPLHVRTRPGELVRLDASGSSDPDGDDLSYRWWVYREAGTYGKEVGVRDPSSKQAVLRVPDDAAGRSVHVILEVTDDGRPPLTAYRRIIVAVD